MLSSTFMFAAGDYDADFYELDARIASMARAIPGYLGEESWENPQTGQIANVYYWENEAALQQLMQHPDHLAAKREQARWLNGYQVVIAEVKGVYGDGRLAHPLAALANKRRQ
ncbi:antibiotic biosynthesis monooxygenase family protein [Chitinilyticum litopenaei]|uniref:antibiotic biosynthesis monooxygenase family protein n=1 Tax=Chitinilyticum litopenaei TaxID=1121276 RepID=UPI00048AD637|nr:antibiotic biosynthesis monooxygenase [Chitinilyticum litopenaei]